MMNEMVKIALLPCENGTARDLPPPHPPTRGWTKKNKQWRCDRHMPHAEDTAEVHAMHSRGSRRWESVSCHPRYHFSNSLAGDYFCYFVEE